MYAVLLFCFLPCANAILFIFNTKVLSHHITSFVALKLHCLGIIHVVRSQNLLKNKHFLPPDTHT